MYLRFVVGSDSENAYWLAGVFTAAYALRDEGKLYRHEVEWLDQTFRWFGKHLPCPPLAANRRSGDWTDDAVCWFRDTAGEPLRRIWDIVALLEENGIPVRLVRADKPGRIVYQDEYQVVAETLPWA